MTIEKFSSSVIAFLLISAAFGPIHSTWAQSQGHIDHAPNHGLFIEAPKQVGLIIDSAGTGAQIIRSEGVGLGMAYNKGNGIYMLQTGSNGMLLDSTDLNGIYIRRAGRNGVRVEASDSNGIDIRKSAENGLYIKGAKRGIDITGVNEGVRIGHCGGNGVIIENPFHNGVEIIASGQDGVRIRNTEAQGVDIRNTGSNGIRIQEAGVHGIEILDPNSRGIQVFNAGGTGIAVSESGGHGLHISNSKNNGVNIYHTDEAGIQMMHPGTHGVLIDSAGADGIVINNPGDDGINIIDPTDDGITILGAGNDGIHVNGAAGSAGIFINSMTSTDPSVLVSHPDDDELDLRFGGNAMIQAEANYEIQLDGDDALGDATFIIRNSSGFASIVATEDGDLGVAGHLSKGSGSFKIDHPLDPQNKYLYHSFVESPDMMNIYNGNVILDEKGEAQIKMPAWFDPLNRDFRYQLTPIGAPADLFILEKMKAGVFKIGGGEPNLEVSWQVTGIRQDRYANKHRLQVEVEKEVEKKGTYLHPDAWSEEIVEPAQDRPEKR